MPTDIGDESHFSTFATSRSCTRHRREGGIGGHEALLPEAALKDLT